MSATPAGAAIRGWPGAGLETPAEPVLAVVTLVVVRKEAESKAVSETVRSGQTSLCSVDIPADCLALRPCHDVLVPVQQPVVPVALLVYLDVAAAAVCRGRSGFRSGGRLGGRNDGLPGGRVSRSGNYGFPRGGVDCAGCWIQGFPRRGVSCGGAGSRSWCCRMGGPRTVGDIGHCGSTDTDLTARERQLLHPVLQRQIRTWRAPRSGPACSSCSRSE